MEEDKTITTVLKIIGTVICVFIVSVSGCTANRHYQTRILVESGKTDAVGAQCALNGDAIESCRNIVTRDMVNRK